jgi:MFS family permease
MFGIHTGINSNLWPILQQKFGFGHMTTEQYSYLMGTMAIPCILANTGGIVLGVYAMKYGRKRNLLMAALIGMFGIAFQQVMYFPVFVFGTIIW